MAPKKEKKKKEKKTEEPPPEPEPEPEPAPPKPSDDEPVEWGTGEETAAETPADAPPAEGEEGKATEGGFGDDAPPEPEPEPVYHKPVQIGLHWKKPYMKMYSYNYDVDEFYYKPLVDYLNEKDRGISPGHQTYAERCVKYWPGKQRQDTLLEEIRREINAKIAKKKTDEISAVIKEEFPKWKDPLDPRLNFGIEQTRIDPVHLKAAKKNTHVTDDVMDIFGLKVPDASNTVDQDLAMFLRRIRRPLVPDLLQIEDDLSRYRRLQSEIIDETINSPVHAKTRPTVTRSRPHSMHIHSDGHASMKSLVASETMYTMERSQTIEQKARMFQRKKVAWRY